MKKRVLFILLAVAVLPAGGCTGKENGGNIVVIEDGGESGQEIGTQPGQTEEKGGSGQGAGPEPEGAAGGKAVQGTETEPEGAAGGKAGQGAETEPERTAGGKAGQGTGTEPEAAAGGKEEAGTGQGKEAEEEGKAGTGQEKAAQEEGKAGADSEEGTMDASGLLTEEEKLLSERMEYYQKSAYYPEITDYWENVREVRDVSNRIEPLYESDKRYLDREELAAEPALVIHLAKNEIYARHGYIFKDQDLYNYFMGCIWYMSATAPEDFSDAVFNSYEKKNLELLSELDRFVI